MADLYRDVCADGRSVCVSDSDSFCGTWRYRTAFADSGGVISGADQENKEDGQFTGIISLSMQ